MAKRKKTKSQLAFAKMSESARKAFFAKCGAKSPTKFTPGCKKAKKAGTKGNAAKKAAKRKPARAGKRTKTS